MMLSNISQFVESFYKGNFFAPSVYSRKEPNHSSCNTSHFTEQKQIQVVQDCEQTRPDQCNRLQERFNALTREKNLLQNQNSELNNMIRKVEDERDRLKMKLSGKAVTSHHVHSFLSHSDIM